MPFVPVAEWLPDRPVFDNTGSNTITNVLPRTDQSYGPMPSLSPSASAIHARCQGAASFRDLSSTTFLVCGDATALYVMASGDTAPVNRSGTAYTTGIDDAWQFAQFGNRVIATNFNDPVQSYMLNGSTPFSPLLTTAGPSNFGARYVSVIRDFVMFGNTVDSVNGPQAQRVWWTGINDPTNMPDPGTSAANAVQSDFQDLVGPYGTVQGVVGNLGFSHGAVFQERAVWRVNYAQEPVIFQFDVAEGVRGTPSPSSIVQLGPVVYYLGEDGFYVFDGAQSQPIGHQKVDRFFFADVDQGNLNKITGAADVLTKTIWWAYPGQGSTQGIPNRVISYNWGLGRWSVTAPGDITCEVIFSGTSFGKTLEQLDALYPSIDAMPLSLDDRALTGGANVISAFDSLHRPCTFGGANLAPVVDTSEVQLNPGGRAFIRQTRPIVDGGVPSVAIATRSRMEDAAVLNTAVAIDDAGWCPQRAEGRYLRGRLTLPAGSTFTHISGMDVDFAPSGMR